jgi:very-short-patch-repair endonuclease
VQTNPDPSDLYATAKKRGLISTAHHLPYDPRLVERARELRRNMTPAEKKLWFGFLRDFRHRVLRQRPIDHFIVDFYCPQLRLVIEVDGESHFTEVGETSDSERTAVLEGYGLRVMRFNNQEVLRNLEGVCAAIEAVGDPSPPAPLHKGG